MKYTVWVWWRWCQAQTHKSSSCALAGCYNFWQPYKKSNQSHFLSQSSVTQQLCNLQNTRKNMKPFNLKRTEKIRQSEGDCRECYLYRSKKAIPKLTMWVKSLQKESLIERSLSCCKTCFSLHELQEGGTVFRSMWMTSWTIRSGSHIVPHWSGLKTNLL